MPGADLPDPSAEWVFVVPVKGTPSAKSRFGPGDNSALAEAMALDTVEVALTVGRVIVVSSDAAAFAALGVTVVADPGGGLNAAITAGLDRAGLAVPRAVLLGDHPALTSAELRAVLGAASRHPLAFVVDASGEGTALTTAGPGVPHAPLFGHGSAAAHRAAGYVPLGGDWPGLRLDVDTAADLAALRELGRLGPRTRALAGLGSGHPEA